MTATIEAVTTTGTVVDEDAQRELAAQRVVRVRSGETGRTRATAPG